jgi:hypothetical protein
MRVLVCDDDLEVGPVIGRVFDLLAVSKIDLQALVRLSRSAVAGVSGDVPT